MVSDRYTHRQQLLARDLHLETVGGSELHVLQKMEWYQNADDIPDNEIRLYHEVPSYVQRRACPADRQSNNFQSA